jgi:hypothetical protein
MKVKRIAQLFCAVAIVLALPGCRVVEFGPEVANAEPLSKMRMVLVKPDLMFRTALTESRLDQLGCTFESLGRDANRRIRARLFESLVVTLPSRHVDYEPRNKLVFYFDDGKVETLVFAKRFDNRNAIDAEWEGLPAQVADSLPAELAQFAANAHLKQLNPQADACDFHGRE